MTNIPTDQQYLMDTYGFDQLTAWRHLRDRAILRERYAYQSRERVKAYIQENSRRG